MRPFDYINCPNLGDACKVLFQHREQGKIIAGGQSLVPLLRQRLISPSPIINIKGLTDLAYINDGPNSVKIGALTIHRALETSPLIKQRFPILVDAERRVGNVQVRNWGTVGGNLCHADPAGDLAPPLMALGAKVKAVRVRGEREIPLNSFFVNLFTTALEADEILAEIEVPHLSPGSGGAYRKESVIAGGSPIASVAVVVSLNGGQVAREVRIVLGGAGPTPVRAVRAEQFVSGKKIDTDIAEQAGAIAAAEANPTASVDGSVEYKRHIVHVLTAEMIGLALERARSGRS